MLQQIREKFTGLFAGVLLSMLLISFVFWGIGNFDFLNAGYAAKVDDVEISVFQLENAYQNRLLQLEDYSDLPESTLRAIRANTLERLIRDVAVDNYVAREGFRVSDDLIAKLIQSEPQFQEDGVFKKELYYNWLDQTVQDPRVFEAQQRRALRLSQLQRGIGATAFVTPSEYRRYLNLYAEERIVSVATFDINALAATIVVKDEDIQDYYDARPDDFRSPESVDFRYLELDRDALAEQIAISEDVLQEYYAANSGRFLQDEQRRASHILIPFGDDEAAAEEQARSLTARAQAGEPFADLARDYSKDGGTANQGGDLGTVMQSQMPGALGDAIFAMKKGEISGPVRTQFGFHVVKLDDIIPGGPLPLDQVRGELLQELRAQTVDDRFREIEGKLSDALFDAKDLGTIAATAGLEVKTATRFTRSGGEPFGANQVVIDTVYEPSVLDDRQISDIVEIDANRSIMVQVTDYHEEARKPLDEVRDDIVAALQADRALNIMDDRSRRLREALENGADFEETAFQLEAEFTPDVRLNRYQQQLDAGVMNAVFRAKKPSPGKARLGSTIASNGDYVVFMLKAVIPGRPESIPLADRDQRKEELQIAAGASDYNAFVNELERTSEVDRSADALSGPEFPQ